jgi:hypothetical protein
MSRVFTIAVLVIAMVALIISMKSHGLSTPPPQTATLEPPTNFIMDELAVGETNTYTLDDLLYEVTLVEIKDYSCVFLVNGEETPLIPAGESVQVADGQTFTVAVVYEDSAAFFLGN